MIESQKFGSPGINVGKLQFSRAEAASILSISVRTLDRIIANNNLPVTRIGRRRLISRDALLASVRQNRTILTEAA